jgi:hypothetical protein
MVVSKIVPQFFQLKIVKIVFCFLVPILYTISIKLTTMYDKRSMIILKLNKIFSGRIFLQSRYWNKYGITLFGQDFDSNFEDLYFLDSGYIRSLLQFGLVFAVFISIGYSIIFYKALTKKNISVVFLTLFCVMLGFTESSFLKIICNVSFLLFYNKNLIGCRKNFFGVYFKKNKRLLGKIRKVGL